MLDFREPVHAAQHDSWALSILLALGDNCPVLGVGSMVMHATLLPFFSNSSWFYAVIFLYGNKILTFKSKQ